MQIKFLGIGGAFDTDYLNSAALLDFRGIHMLIDCGFTVFPALVKKSLIAKVDHIILTHLHNDHCGILANLLVYKQVIEKSKPPVILYPSESFRQQLYKFLKILEEEYRFVYSGYLGKTDVLFERLEKMPTIHTCVFHNITFNAENSGHTFYKK